MEYQWYRLILIEQLSNELKLCDFNYFYVNYKVDSYKLYLILLYFLEGQLRRPESEMFTAPNS